MTPMQTQDGAEREHGRQPVGPELGGEQQVHWRALYGRPTVPAGRRPQARRPAGAGAAHSDVAQAILRPRTRGTDIGSCW